MLNFLHLEKRKGIRNFTCLNIIESSIVVHYILCMENVEIKKIFLLSYNNLYKDCDIDPGTALKDIPQIPALEFITYLLHLYNVRKRDDTGFQSRHLMQWMMQMQSADKNKMANFIQQESTFIFDPSFKIIDRRPCLDLLQHILVYSSLIEHPLNEVHYTILFRCLLHFNSLENRAQEQLFNWNVKGTIEQFANHVLTVQVRNIEHERPKDYVLQFLKVYHFFVFCESHEKYSAHLNVFLTSLGLISYRSYLLKLISPYLHLMLSQEPTPKMHIDSGEEIMDLYVGLKINGKIVATDNDYKSLRQYPLFEIEKNMYIFLDFRFFVDKFYQGFLFDFAAKIKITYGHLKTNMGNEFSEHILFYSVMNKCFSSYGSIHLTGIEIKKKIFSGEPDYYIRNGLEIFLFEFKDVVISADVKYSGDSEKIKKGIAEKLEKSPDGKRKGVTQLLNTVKEISSGHNQEKAVDLIPADQTIFYPIIVHTDITLESCGVNYFLNKRMVELIVELELSHLIIKNLVLS